MTSVKKRKSDNRNSHMINATGIVMKEFRDPFGNRLDTEENNG